MNRPRRGQMPLWMALVLAGLLVVALIWWTRRSVASSEAENGKETLVFWGSSNFGEDIYTVIHQFEEQNPRYKVIMGSAVARNLTGDAQRLLCAVAGGVPPDVVFFDRFAIGEWAGRGALEDLTPYIKAQDPTGEIRQMKRQHDAALVAARRMSGDAAKAAVKSADEAFMAGLTKIGPDALWSGVNLLDFDVAPDGVNLTDYYKYTVDEASYRPPGSHEPAGIYGIPVNVDIRVLYSNANLLRQEGLVDANRQPRPPANWAELRDYARRLTRHKDSADKQSGITRLGFGPNYGNSWLYMYAWQAGGELINPDRTRITLDSPEVVRALRYMTDVYDDAGGYKQVDAFQSSFQQGELDPFLRGQVAMKIDGDWSLASIADWKRDMDFVVSPAPMPQDRLDAGHKPITWAGGWALVVPRTARNKTGAFKLIQHLRSWRTMALLEQGKREMKESEGKLYLPGGNANQKFYEQLIVDHVDNSPDMPKRFKEAYAVLKEMMPRTLYRPVTPVGQELWEQHRMGYESAVNHEYAAQAAGGKAQLEAMDVAQLGEVARKEQILEPLAGKKADLIQQIMLWRETRMSLHHAQEPVQKRLDELIKPLPAETVVHWRPYLWVYGAIVILPFGAMYLTYLRRKRAYSYKAGEVGAAMLFASPWMIGFIVFVGGPILFSIVFSFTRYNVLSDAHYVGLDNYRQIFADDLFYKSLGNTLFMVLRIPLVMALGLMIAMLLNRSMRGMGSYRTAFYMPAIVPMVAASLLWIWLFNPSQGALNGALNWLFSTPPAHWLEWLIGLFTHDPVKLRAPLWLQDQNWSKPGLIIMNLWTAGGGMVIWLAGLQSIPQQLYEAASIDGAGPWRRFRHVTLPMLSPYILFNLIMGLIGTMQIFGEAFIMTEGGPANSTLFYAYHLFKEAFQFFRMGQASALAWILFVIVLLLTLTQLWSSKRWVHYERG